MFILLFSHEKKWWHFLADDVIGNSFVVIFKLKILPQTNMTESDIERTVKIYIDSWLKHYSQDYNNTKWRS